jgi:acyl carrier protein
MPPHEALRCAALAVRGTQDLRHWPPTAGRSDTGVVMRQQTGRPDIDDPHVVLATVLHRVAPDVDLDDIDPDDLIQEAADLDSMDFLNMMTALHELTGIDVPERDYPQLATIAAAERYIGEHTR